MAPSAPTDADAGTLDPAIRRMNSNRPHRSLRQQRAEANLAQHPYQLELRGHMGSLTWPSVCAWCGTTASGRIHVPKSFLRPRMHGRRSPTMRTIIIRAADVPFCAECSARHEATVQRPTLAAQLFRTLLTPLLIPMIGSVIMGTLTWRAARDIRPGDPGSLIPWSIIGLFVFIFFWSLVGAWRSSRAHRIEKQTDVTLACDFSDDVSQLFEGERRIYKMRNREFAESFASLNRDRAWTEADDRRSSRHSLIILGVIVAVGAIIWAVVVLGP
jgi:hypothetical protein